MRHLPTPVEVGIVTVFGSVIVIGGIAVGLTIGENSARSAVPNVTRQAHKEVAGFVSLNSADISTAYNKGGFNPLRITYSHAGAQLMCTATIGDSSKGMTIKSLNDCPPKR